MITVGNERLFHLIGLSTDRKPVNSKHDPVTIGNGSIFTEMDTSKTFIFDAENKVWIEKTGGGGSPLKDLVAGTGIKIEGNQIAVDTEVVPEKEAVKEIISEQAPVIIPKVLIDVEMDGGEIE